MESLRSYIDRHRGEILSRWREYWEFIQTRRPDSHFPDPPYESILDQLPYDPARSSKIADDVLEWYTRSPIFCTGAAFCQLQATIAAILYRDQLPQRGAFLSELDLSLEAIILDAGTRRWVATLLSDTGKQEAVHSERLAVIGQLAAGVAHEIGNPLASISSIVQILLRRTDDAFVMEQLGNVKKSIDRIARIVRELTDFSRPAPMAPTLVQIQDILRTAFSLVQYDRRAKNITFAMEAPPVLPAVSIVADQLLQVFVNLLINAVDAMNGDGVITARAFATDATVRIAITDTGHGIPGEILGRIFDPFFTTKPIGKGTGLGLSVSYGLLKRFGGSIEVSSEPGAGSTFTVILPAASA